MVDNILSFCPTLIGIVIAGSLLLVSITALLLHRRGLSNPQHDDLLGLILRLNSNISLFDSEDDEPSGGLSSTFVQKLPQFKTSKPGGGDGSECVICLDGFRKGRWCRRLPGCGHVFHRKCVDTWFLKAATCPTCRAPVRLMEEDAQQGGLSKR